MPDWTEILEQGVLFFLLVFTLIGVYRLAVSGLEIWAKHLANLEKQESEYSEKILSLLLDVREFLIIVNNNNPRVERALQHISDAVKELLTVYISKEKSHEHLEKTVKLLIGDQNEKIETLMKSHQESRQSGQNYVSFLNERLENMEKEMPNRIKDMLKND